MRIHLATSLILLLALPSCKKVKGLLATAKAVAPKPTASSSMAPASAPAAAPVAPGAVVQELGSADYDTFIATPGRLMVVDFHADWCGPCKMLGPVLEQVAGEFSGTVCIGKVNIDHAKGIAQREGVRSIPDVRIFRDGKEVHRFVGAVDAAGIRALFQKHGEGLQVATQEAPAASTSPPTAEPSIQPMKKDWRPPGVERR